ncbi:Pep3/Vps18/deep orange family-domain-containing protein [Gaertneriomyces semiglobifer]|nr:Pep3/Vps18/deep orange family-domain-containing protein [Gaertneriomyces semiglobifer]
MSLFDQFENERVDDIGALTSSRKAQDVVLPVVLEKGYVSAVRESQLQVLPMFSLDRVQFPLNFPVVNILSLAVSNNFLVFAVDNAVPGSGKNPGHGQRIYRIDLGSSDNIDELDPGLKQKGDKIRKIFLDPTAKHLLFTTDAGDNYYLHEKWKKPRLLSKYRGIQIESVAWGKPRQTDEESTGVMLLGSRQGSIYEAELRATDEFFKKEERYFRHVYQMSEAAPVSSIRYEQFPAVSNKYVVFAATTHNLYQFIGNVADGDVDRGMFAELFRAYEDHPASVQEMPGDRQDSDLQFWSPFIKETGYPSMPKSFGWLADPGLYCGDLVFGNQAIGDSVINNAQLLPYPRASEGHDGTSTDSPQTSIATASPLAISITEFHYVLLYDTTVKAVNALNGEVDYTETIPLEFGEFVLGMSVDSIKSTYWIYTNLALYELIITDEDRDIWGIYLTRKSFDAALSYAKTPAQKERVIIAQADYHFSHQRYMLSATYYARSSSISFEEVVLKFIENDEREALKHYLLQKLESLRGQGMTQVTLISTWLVEIFVNRLNELRDELHNARATFTNMSRAPELNTNLTEAESDLRRLEEENTIALDDFRQFLRKYKTRLDHRTTANIIESHGRTDDLLFFLELVGDNEKVISHYLQQHNYHKALEIVSHQNKVDVWYKFSPALMEQIPFETVNAWIRNPNLNPRHLLPALLKYDAGMSLGKSGNEGENQAVRYLKYVIEKLGNTDGAVHNYLIGEYVKNCKSGNENSLLEFLKSQKDHPHFSLPHAMRLTTRHNLSHSTIYIYSLMSLPEAAVQLSLATHNLPLAQQNANHPSLPPEGRKKLWLQIARYVIHQKRDIPTALQFLRESECLKIEDILPLFPDFVTIDSFKDELLSALASYDERVEELRGLMDEAMQSAESIRIDVRELRHRYAVVEAGSLCKECQQPVLTRGFYIFGCGCAWHGSCLADHVSMMALFFHCFLTE